MLKNLQYTGLLFPVFWRIFTAQIILIEMLPKSILVRCNFFNAAILLSITIFGGFHQMEEYLFGLTKIKG